MILLRWACLISFLLSLNLGLAGCGSGSPESSQQIAARQIPKDRADRIEKLKADATLRQQKRRKDKPLPPKAGPVQR